ncbi:MAG: alpha-ribazole phosphatase [Candidatus Microsyncoccus archaeolyticus]|nr:MAG: alpha-ribazole phosphatase [Candidatus Parcubacteria bacterium]
MLMNKYYLLRHGKNNHQEENPDILYCYPDNDTPCFLIEEGINQVKRSGGILKDKNIDLIFCSDILRTRQTAKIVAEIIGFDLNKIIYDVRLRDINWGIFGGKSKKEAWDFHENNKINMFENTPPKGENWNKCQERMKNVFNEIENNFQGKNVLIISHGDPLWLLEGYVKGLSKEDLINQREGKGIINTGEIREL